MRLLITLILLTGFFSKPIQAQLHLKVGYTAGYTTPDFFNTVINEYNAARPWLSNPMDEMAYLQGLQLGFRYKIGPVGLDFTWHNRFKQIRSEGIDPADNSSNERSLNFRLSSFAFGIENIIGNFSYGGSFDINNLNIKTKKTGRDDRFTIEDQYGTGSHFFVSWTFEASPLLYFSIRPFVQIPWSKFELNDYSDELNPGTNYPDYEERFMNFGIMFIFFNGE